MAESTKIAWCDSTFNPFIGCTKIGPGCDHCYAAEQDSRKRWDGGKTHWGPSVPRYRTSVANWRHPLAWNRKQGLLLAGWQSGIKVTGGDEAELLRRGFLKPEPWRVFCASLADVFDNEVPDQWRRDLFDLICDTPNLSWLLVTKRIGNVAKMIPVEWGIVGWPENARLLITVCNQEEADRDIPKLLALPCKNGISYEPALGPVDWMPWLAHQYDGGHDTGGPAGDLCRVCGVLTNGRHHPYATGLEWLIVGGESGSKARPFDLAWARSTVEQCKAAGVPCFVKQYGSYPLFHGDRVVLKDRAGADPAEWLEPLRVRHFP